MAVPADDSISGAAVPLWEDLSTAPAALERGAPVSDSDKKSESFEKKDAPAQSLVVTTLKGENAVRPTCELNQSSAVSSYFKPSPSSKSSLSEF